MTCHGFSRAAGAPERRALLALDLHNEPLKQLRGSLRCILVRVNLRMPTCRIRFSQSTLNEEFRQRTGLGRCAMGMLRSVHVFTPTPI